MAYDLSNLSPDEKDRLLQELISRYQNDVPVPGNAPDANPMADHPDAPQDQAMLEPFAQVLDIVISKLEELEQRIEANEKLVVDDLFGGIDRMYKSNLRAKSVDGLRGKYGPVFEPHMSALEELAPGEDIYEALHDMLDRLRGEGGEGFGEEQEADAVRGVADAIGAKIAKIKGPAAASVEVTTAEPVAEEPTQEPKDKFLDNVRKMKENAKAKGL